MKRLWLLSGLKWGAAEGLGMEFECFKVICWIKNKTLLQAINAGEGVEKREPSYTVGGNAN